MIFCPVSQERERKRTNTEKNSSLNEMTMISGERWCSFFPNPTKLYLQFEGLKKRPIVVSVLQIIFDWRSFQALKLRNLSSGHRVESHSRPLYFALSFRSYCPTDIFGEKPCHFFLQIMSQIVNIVSLALWKNDWKVIEKNIQTKKIWLGQKREWTERFSGLYSF